MYRIDPWDPRLYELVAQVGKISVDDVADIICHTVGLERFKTTIESQQAMDDLSISAEVKAALIDLKRDIHVFADNGIVNVKATTLESNEFKLIQDIRKIVEKIPHVKEVKIDVVPVPILPHH